MNQKCGGYFFTEYNPTYTELLIGSGPLNFSQLYEGVINDLRIIFTTLFFIVPSCVYWIYTDYIISFINY